MNSPGDADGERAAGVAVRQWLRHHASAVVATVSDYVTMVAAVEAFRRTPVTGTILGAAVGAFVSFVLGRMWIYRQRAEDIRRQAIRYGIVSATSLAMNALGEYVLAHRVGLQYIFARVITSLVVSNAWNYPMHRFFVFAPARRSAP